MSQGKRLVSAPPDTWVVELARTDKELNRTQLLGWWIDTDLGDFDDDGNVPCEFVAKPIPAVTFVTAPPRHYLIQHPGGYYTDGNTGLRLDHLESDADAYAYIEASTPKRRAAR
jgi:hypothetical protein